MNEEKPPTLFESAALAGRLDVRPGHKVVSFAEVGLPVFMVAPLVTLRERTPIGVLEEIILKSLDTAVDTVDSLAAFLGIPSSIVATQIGILVYEETVRFDSRMSRYLLNPKGVMRLQELNKAQVSKEELRLFVDGLTRSLVPVEQADLYSGRQLEELAIPVITPSPRRPPRARDIAVTEVNRLFDIYASEEKAERYAIKLESSLRRTLLLFRRAVALAFKPDSGRGMSIAFAIDGRLSDEHEVAFSATGAVTRSGLFRDLLDATKRRAEVVASRKHVQEFAPAVLDASPRHQSGKRYAGGTALQTTSGGSNALPTAVRTLTSYEHPELLESALRSAQHRLVVVSPWIRQQVVNEGFLQMLRECLGRDVEVTIACGFGRTDRVARPEDVAACDALDSLTHEFPKFRFARRTNLHAKVLLVDDKHLVITSFNWLSFQGDPNRALREDEGLYVEGAAFINEYLDRTAKHLFVRDQA